MEVASITLGLAQWMTTPTSTYNDITYNVKEHSISDPHPRKIRMTTKKPSKQKIFLAFLDDWLDHCTLNKIRSVEMLCSDYGFFLNLDLNMCPKRDLKYKWNIFLNNCINVRHDYDVLVMKVKLVVLQQEHCSFKINMTSVIIMPSLDLWERA